ncbi:MAG: hypothetical protein WC455_16350 [Dehalococcoidia bacterium]|jgi:hypothetical protein
MENEIKEIEKDFDNLMDDNGDDDREFCEMCGNEIIPYERGHCPSCYGCGESYTCGSEECDWCPFEAGCASR